MRAERFQNTTPMLPDEVQAPPSVFSLVETMMALDPARRHQTLSQLLDRIREVRQEVDGKSRVDVEVRPQTLFLAEADPRLQDLLRAKLKQAGYRVLIAADPARALDRFRLQPFDVLIVNGSTTSDLGCHMFARILQEAVSRQLRCRGILLVDPQQGDWRDRLAGQHGVSVLVHPIRFKQLLGAIRDLTA
jgi:CheY-like chemotaxis protein